MEIPLEKLAHFFASPARRTMPKEVMDLVMRGNTFTSKKFSTQTIEWRQLHEHFAPDIAARVEVPSTGYNLPVVRVVDTPTYLVYHPFNGKYLGSFDVNP